MRLERYFDAIEVTELLAEPYTHHVFPGYENIDYDFLSIKTIIDREVPDWKAALKSVKGIYMLTDMNNGKRYIGSAYGENGVWSRWQQYCSTWHGGNIELKKLLDKHDEKYIQKFKFTLLEIHPVFTSDDFIILRENYWKNVMLSRNEKYGYNDN